MIPLEQLKTDPAVLCMAKKFDARPSQKQRFTFFELLERFADPTQRISAIAKEAGVTRQAMTFIHDEYFKPLLGEKSGIARLSESVLLSQERQRLELEVTETFHSPRLACIAEQARTAGHCVHPVGVFMPNHKDCYRENSRLINVSGTICRTYIATKKFAARGNYAPYAHFNLSKRVLDRKSFSILLCAVPVYGKRIFVIPNTVLLKAFKPKKPYGNVYIRLTDRISPTHYFKVDWLKYENAWDLIKTPPP